VPSNDSVPSLARTHYTHMVFRAIENRVALVKADRMRDAAVIDPWGRVVAKVVDPAGRRSTLIADVPPGTHDALLVRFGDWLGWLCLAAAALLLFADPQSPLRSAVRRIYRR
jgi:apolipoprotein N-acyltransferase